MNKKKILAALKEIGICLLLVILALGINAALFATRYPRNVEVPDAAVYVSIDRDNYVLANATIQDAKKQDVVFQSTKSLLDKYVGDYRYYEGTTNPFESEHVDSNIPNDYISSSSNYVESGDMTNLGDEVE